jgi:spore coat polysaccharide biosynthesis predicted glycosyltransferase SpsG
VRRAGNDWLDADATAGTEEDVEETLREVRRLQPAAVIVDSPEVQESYLNELRSEGVQVVSIDHAGAIRFPSHLLINPLLGPDKETYEFYPGTQILMGARCAMVRSEVRKCRAIRSQEPVKQQATNGKAVTGQYRVLISLGEDDPHEQSQALAKLMLSMPKIGKVDVAVRPHHPGVEQLRALAEQNAERLEIAVEPAEVAARIVRCHFAVTGGSGWSLELASVGVPQLMILQSEAYWPTAQRLEEEGCATCLGWHENVSAQTIRTSVANILTDPFERQAMSRCGRQLIDARGPDRLIHALEVKLHSPQVSSYRSAA